MSPPRIPPSASEERGLLRCALRLLTGYLGGAALVVGVLHLVAGVGAAWQALALIAAGGVAAVAGIAGARAALREADRDRVVSRHRQGRMHRPPMADHDLGRRVG